VKDRTFRISADDFVVRHLRFGAGHTADAIDLDSGSLNSMIDHCDARFGGDENFSSFESPPENMTFQWGLNAWGVESHSCGGMWDQNHVTCGHSLWAHNRTRNPKARPSVLDWINNVTFDFDIGFIMGDSDTPANWNANVRGSYFICPAHGRIAFAATLANLAATFSKGLWYSADGETLTELARTGRPAPHGGKFAALSSLALPDGATSGPIFTATLTADTAAGISAANNFGVWAVNSSGVLKLVLRTRQKVIVNAAPMTIKSFTALTPAPGSIGAAHGYERRPPRRPRHLHRRNRRPPRAHRALTFPGQRSDARGGVNHKGQRPERPLVTPRAPGRAAAPGPRGQQRPRPAHSPPGFRSPQKRARSARPR
jgi:hypothetical protein